MPEWKQWHVLGSGEFPILEYLSIKNCRKLMVGEMSYCNMILKELRLEERDISPELLPRACELTVGGCPNLTRSMIPTAPERISIWRCENLEKNSELLPSLKKLELWYPEIESSPFLKEDCPAIYKSLLCDGEMEHDGSVEEIKHDGSDEEIEHDGSDEEIEHDGSENLSVKSSLKSN
ncbi:hypothetical protein KY289_025083 [Solanum tuberosum]|nr:hypothetical protein KY289_025083 [Solanum tuberosum]